MNPWHDPEPDQGASRRDVHVAKSPFDKVKDATTGAVGLGKHVAGSVTKTVIRTAMKAAHTVGAVKSRVAKAPAARAPVAKAAPKAPSRPAAPASPSPAAVAKVVAKKAPAKKTPAAKRAAKRTPARKADTPGDKLPVKKAVPPATSPKTVVHRSVSPGSS